MVEVRSYTEVLMFTASNLRQPAPGEVIFSEGDPAREMYIVREGSVELRKAGALLESLGPGDILGEMALIDPAPRSATAVVGEGCVLAAVDEETFRLVVQKVPGFALEILRTVVRRLRKEITR
jgi:CRP/FNR family transcriptional regulator, cyclic AMP receptor protein